MILLLDTATPVCQLVLFDDSWRQEAKWEAGRGLAKGLLGYIEAELGRQDKAFSDLTGIGVFVGPGSFTGLRIGLTVCNTLADTLEIPIVGETGGDWQNNAVTRLRQGEDEKIVLPLYGSEVRITAPRK